MAMFGNPMGSFGGSRLRGGDIRDELKQGVLGSIQFPRVDIPQFDLPPAESAPQPQRGGVVRGIAGSIGDYLLQRAGAAPIYAPQMRQNQILQQRQAEHERQRQDSWADFVRKAEYERANPKPIANDTVADYNFIVERLGPEAGKAFLENKTLPPPFVQKNPDGTSTIYPQGLPRTSAPPAPAPGAIEDGYRFKGGNPADPNSWEPVGGAGSGPRPFP